MLFRSAASFSLGLHARIVRADRAALLVLEQRINQLEGRNGQRISA